MVMNAEERFTFAALQLHLVTCPYEWKIIDSLVFTVYWSIDLIEFEAGNISASELAVLHLLLFNRNIVKSLFYSDVFENADVDFTYPYINHRRTYSSISLNPCSMAICMSVVCLYTWISSTCIYLRHIDS